MTYLRMFAVVFAVALLADVVPPRADDKADCIDNYETLIKADPTKVVAACNTLAALGDVRAQNNLGWLFANGQGVQRDYPKAPHWFRMAADQGLAEAQISVGWMYGTGIGVPKDYVEAVNWYKKVRFAGECTHWRERANR
jgi:TPR repeat protein